MGTIGEQIQLGTKRNAKKISNLGRNVVSKTGDILGDLEGSFKDVLHNKYVSTIIKVLIAIYAAFAAPQLTRQTAMFFDNVFVRIVIAVLIIYLATTDASMAILVALAFILTLQTANKYKLIDSSKSINTSSSSLSWLPSQNTEHFTDNINDEYYEEQEEELNMSNHPERQILNEDTDIKHHDQSGDYAPVVNRHSVNGEELYNQHPTHYPTNVPTNNPTHHPMDNYILNDVVLPTQGPTPTHTMVPTPTHTMVPNATPSNCNNRQRTVDNLPDIGDNSIPGTNQKSCVQSMRNQHCIQGLNNPMGGNVSTSPYSNN